LEISKIVKEYRISHDLSIREMAKQCGVSHSYIAILENESNPNTGNKSNPTAQILRKLAKGMGITYAELLVLMGEIDTSNDTPFEEMFPPEGNEKATIQKDDRRVDSMRVGLINRVMSMSEDQLEKLEQILDLLQK